MNIEQLEEIVFNLLGPEEGDNALREQLNSGFLHLREVAQAALDLIPKDTLLVEVMETRNDLIDSFNLIDDQ